ncbi:MAG: T9SS type A sorting domain-containing protein [Fidelibacterota bacterium]
MYIGGSVGYSTTPISNCYSTGNVAGDNNVGGLVGQNNNEISKSYSTGSVTSNTDVGGLVGDNSSSTISNSFWDVETDEIDGNSSGDDNFGTTGKSTTQMKDVATFIDETTVGLTTAWDFETNPNDDNEDNDYWDMDNSGSTNDGYPFLSWENGEDVSLPVELTAFTAECRNGGVLLEWTTESEVENLGFIIQRKQETGNWNQVVSYLSDPALEGHGSTTQRHDYGYTDTQVQPGASYAYRLGDVDFSGSVAWHDAVEITIPVEDAAVPAEFGLQKAYPNPFNPAVTLRYNLTKDAETTLQIYNMRGQLVEVLENTYKLKGTYDFVWQPQNLSTGVYIVRLQSGNQTNLQNIVLSNKP